eukprot:TRINITY_DN117097_c0_g1_i1.p1 TRINITY_DN117097_c0_g1~~TRINITY_DN117097_c0_g1_i1.p1  ORF type:complete len:415 (-),score=80.96 TRINITY_DN117097_c0_g1_i1:182-1426(-)
MSQLNTFIGPYPLIYAHHAENGPALRPTVASSDNRYVVRGQAFAILNASRSNLALFCASALFIRRSTVRRHGRRPNQRRFMKVCRFHSATGSATASARRATASESEPEPDEEDKEYEDDYDEELERRIREGYDEDIGMPQQMSPEETEKVLKKLQGGPGSRVSETGDLMGNGKLMKTIIKAAPFKVMPLRPQLGDDVSIHFIGTLEDGKVFDDSRRNRGDHDPFKFRLGMGHVIKGLDEGVATMVKGERALFEIHSELAYGEAGAGWKIPPNANVRFDVEVIDVEELDPLVEEDEDDQIEEEPWGRDDVGEGGEGPNGRYRWDRRGQEVVVTVPLSDEIRAKDIVAEFYLKRVFVKAGDEVILQGVPGCDLEREECSWEVEPDVDGRRCLVINLQKKAADDVRWPDSLLVEMSE